MRKVKYLLMAVALLVCSETTNAQSKTTKSKKSTTAYTQKKKGSTAKRSTSSSSRSKKSSGTSWRMNVPTWKGLRVSFDHTFMINEGEKGEIQDDLGLDDDYGYIGDMNGFSIGYVQAIKLGKIPLFLELGGQLNYAKWSWNENYFDGPDGEENNPEYNYDLTQSVTSVGVTIPVNVVYAFRLNKKMTLKPYSGMFFKVYTSAKYKFEIEGDYDPYEINFFKKSDFEDDDEYYDNNRWNRLVIGWTMGCDLDINKKFTVGLDLTYDTSRISKAVRSSKLSLKAGYNF